MVFPSKARWTFLLATKHFDVMSGKYCFEPVKGQFDGLGSGYMARQYIRENNTVKKPCDDCQTGWGNYTRGKDEKGEYIEINSCTDECKKFAEYIKEQTSKWMSR